MATVRHLDPTADRFSKLAEDLHRLTLSVATGVGSLDSTTLVRCAREAEALDLPRGLVMALIDPTMAPIARERAAMLLGRAAQRGVTTTAGDEPSRATLRSTTQVVSRRRSASSTEMTVSSRTA